MAIRIQQISDYGTSNPICARLTFQIGELSEFYKISKKQKEEIFALMLSDVVPKLMVCFRIKEQLTKEIRDRQKKIDEKGLDFQAQGRAYTLPSIVNLRHHAETFLYNAKSALRDFTSVFQILFSKDFEKKAHYDKVLKWAEKQFGWEDSLSKMLAADQIWIWKIVQMRNAVEHPNHNSNILHIENFTGTENGMTMVVVEPVWYLNSEKRIFIAHDMDVFVTNLLTFFEEMLALCMEKFPSGFPIGISEIPEAERNPACPVRFRMMPIGIPVVEAKSSS